MRKSIGIILLGFLAALAACGIIKAQNSAAGAIPPATPLPKDIYPESGNRFPLPNPEEMDDAGKQVYNQIVKVFHQHPSPRLFSPQLDLPLAEAGHYLKFDAGLPPRAMELAVLVTARSFDCQYEWTQWETHAHASSDPRYIEPSVVDIVKYEKPLTGLNVNDAAIINLGREMFIDSKVSSDTFNKVLAMLGRRGIVDLVELMGGYQACVTEMNAFDQQLEKGQTPLLPMLKSHIHNPAAGAGAASTVAATLPKDIYPDSRNRLPLPKREDMDDFGKQVFDQITKQQRLPSTADAGVRLYDPRLAKYLGDAHNYVKYETGIPDRLVEIAVLETARARNCQYEWTQWEAHARDANDPRHIDPAIIDMIKYDKPVLGIGEKEAAIIAFGREMFDKRKVSSETFATVQGLFGRKGTIDLLELMTLYSADAAELTAFDQQLKPGQKPLLPAR